MKILILTGAGISAESGIPTFRAADGLWENHRVEDVATPEGFVRNPELVHAFYNQRRAKLLSAAVQPNPAHQALGTLARQPTVELTLVTQNIDDLHERGGARDVLHMHGELLKAWCLACDQRSPWHAEMDASSSCPACGVSGQLRVDVVWFGEIPYHMARIEQALRTADLFAAIGTSAQVYPAAGFVQRARAAGATCHEFNLQHTAASRAFDRHHFGKASVTVPAWVRLLCQGAA